ncbi:hypothetical protein PanWU01x14_299530 [Parasponia andersonii]|uniref:Uncharacterized protein n=1 Tax=Parasponia andersonii TaxID=3476 RepID=A0A2P5AUA9_PARAD|nr:hypothetical protein PanWU01x14_299530 [Parasponia andersonii]
MKIPRGPTLLLQLYQLDTTLYINTHVILIICDDTKTCSVNAFKVVSLACGVTPISSITGAIVGVVVHYVVSFARNSMDVNMFMVLTTIHDKDGLKSLHVTPSNGVWLLSCCNLRVCVLFYLGMIGVRGIGTVIE